ncbi:MAG: hypothetical protein O3A92_09745 [Verrucomicrobia bacterium]|nr:hypothetical protein [Verrucomicrobiota bacterium]
MLRKLAGSGFAFALIAIVALKHVALGFCLCQAQFITNPDTCCAKHAAEPSCCCEVEAPPADDPCKDCAVDLEIEVGDFLWDADHFSPPDQAGLPMVVPTLDLPTFALQPQTLAFAHPVRSSPPGLPPLYIRQSVLRL